MPDIDTPIWAECQLKTLLPLADPDNPAVAVAALRGMVVGYGWARPGDDQCALRKAVRYAAVRHCSVDAVWVSAPSLCPGCVESATQRGIYIHHVETETT